MTKQTFTTGQVLTAAQMTSLQQTAMLGGEASAKTSSYTLVAANAGDAITMSNAGATTITVNTGLFAAGDIVTIINIGAGVCTITAGTATVTTSGSLALSQNQGGVLRFTSSSAAIFLQFATPASGDIEGVTAGLGISGGGTSGTVTITNSMATAIDAKADLIVGTGADAFSRLAVGANDTVLTADSSTATGLKWATPSSAGKTYTLVNAGGTALSGSSTSITGLSTYDDLIILVSGASFTTGGQGLYMTVNSVSSANSYTRYGIRQIYGASYSNGNNTVFNAANGTEIQWASMSSGAGSAVSGAISIAGCRGSGVKPYNLVAASTSSSGNDNEAVSYQGVVNATTAISSIQIIGISATFDAGTVFVYGAV